MRLNLVWIGPQDPMARSSAAKTWPHNKRPQRRLRLDSDATPMYTIRASPLDHVRRNPFRSNHPLLLAWSTMTSSCSSGSHLVLVSWSYADAHLTSLQPQTIERLP